MCTFLVKHIPQVCYEHKAQTELHQEEQLTDVTCKLNSSAFPKLRAEIAPNFKKNPFTHTHFGVQYFFILSVQTTHSKGHSTVPFPTAHTNSHRATIRVSRLVYTRSTAFLKPASALKAALGKQQLWLAYHQDITIHPVTRRSAVRTSACSLDCWPCRRAGTLTFYFFQHQLQSKFAKSSDNSTWDYLGHPRHSKLLGCSRKDELKSAIIFCEKFSHLVTPLHQTCSGAKLEKKINLVFSVAKQGTQMPNAQIT